MSAGGMGNSRNDIWSPLNAPVTSPGGRLQYVIHRVEDVTDITRSDRMTAHADEAMRLDVMLRAREPQANRQLREVTEQFQAVYDQGLFAARLRLKRALRVRHRGPFHRQGKSLECSRRGEGQSFAKSMSEDGT